VTTTYRNSNIDFLRGIAVLMVMAGHFFKGYVSEHFTWSGVDLFFVISGYLVSGLIFRESINCGRVNISRFLIRRGLKIWPLFYVAFILQLGYYCIKGECPGTGRILNEVFFIQNFFQGFMMVTWSLGAEEQFYLLAGFGLPLLLRYGKVGKKLMAICTGIFIFCFSLRFLNLYFYPEYNPYRHFFPFPLRAADALSAGVFLAYLQYYHADKLQKWVLQYRKLLLLFSFMLLVPLFFFSYKHTFILTAGLSLAFLGYAFLLLCMIFPNKTKTAVEMPLLAFLMNKIAWTGRYSYAIYLFHFFIGFGLTSNFKKLSGATNLIFIEFLIFIAGNILFGYLVSKVVEQPVLKWRDRVFPAYNQKISA
jgi:peptidoglycan/LPS O-acetylase OafA/YrhL